MRTQLNFPFLITKKLLIIITLTLLSFSCSSGGGGGGSSGGGGGTDYSAACSRQGSTYSGCYPERLSYMDDIRSKAEYNNQYGVDYVGAGYAHARELSGAGVKVGILDTGIRTTHREFEHVTLSGYHYYNSNTTLTDGHGHGSHVAGIIFAQKDARDMQGVAYGVTQAYIYKILNDSGVGTGMETKVPDALSRATSAGVQVVNNSWGDPYKITSYTKSAFDNAFPLEIAAHKTASSNNIIQVWATGNDGYDNPTWRAAMPYYWSETSDVWLAVVNIDSSGVESSSSNRCGVAAAYCIAAPGTNIYSTYKNGDSNFAYMSGTSMAAPHVTGAIAILIEAFPNLTASQIVDRLLNTAKKFGLTDRDGNGYSAAVFGAGRINLNDASKPIEVLALSVGGTSISSSASYSLDSTRLKLSKVFGQNRISFTNNTLKNINNFSRQIASTHSIATFDTYDNAMFFLNLSSFTTESTYSPLDLNKIILKDYQEQSLYDFGILKLYGIVNSTDTETDQYNFPFKTLRATISLNDYFKIKYNYAEIQDFFFLSTKKDSRITESLFTYDAFRNPYMGMSGEFEGLEIFLKVNDKLKFSLNYNKEGYVQELESNLSERNKDITLKGFNAYLESSLLDKMNLSYARMEEEGAFLGSQTSGAFKLRNPSVTDIFGVMIEKAINNKLTMYASGFYGSTNAYPDIDSLFTDFETIQSTSWSLGLLYDKVARKNDSIGLVLHQPIKAESGSFNLRLPAYADYKGNIYYEDKTYNLKPNGREINYEAFYEIEVNKMKIRLSSIFIDEGGHLKQSSLEKVFMLELKGAI